MTVARQATLTTWTALAQALRRPYPVTVPMVTLMLLVPFYLVIANRAAVGTVHAPSLPWDVAVPLQPTWALIYGALYMFLIVLPVFVVRQEEHIRRTFWAYLAVWVTAYVCFLVYPTVAPRAPTCYRLHRRLGVAALLCASLVAVSTVFTKQHYILDVIAGILLAVAAYVLILRGYSRHNIPELDRRLAPMLALVVLAIIGLGVIGFWVVYRLQGQV